MSSGRFWRTDRKSTRLNSSHVRISYAVFCLKKKKVATQGDFAQQSTTIRSTYPSLTGACVTVVVLSYCFNCLATYDKSGSTVPFFFNDTATTEIYTLSLHDALPI